MDKRDGQRKEVRSKRCDKVGMKLARGTRKAKKVRLMQEAEQEAIDAMNHALKYYGHV